MFLIPFCLVFLGFVLDCGRSYLFAFSEDRSKTLTERQVWEIKEALIHNPIDRSYSRLVLAISSFSISLASRFQPNAPTFSTIRSGLEALGMGKIILLLVISQLSAICEGVLLPCLSEISSIAALSSLSGLANAP